MACVPTCFFGLITSLSICLNLRWVAYPFQGMGELRLNVKSEDNGRGYGTVVGLMTKQDALRNPFNIA